MINRRHKVTYLAGTVLLSACAAFASIAQAEDKSSPYVMTVIDDHSDGEQVIAGNYHAAIENITSGKARRSNLFASSNNLCVAYTKTNKLREAEQACSAAMRTSKSTFASWYHSGRKRDFYAVALSNRGVIRAVTGDAEGAREDFRAAMRFSSILAAPVENLAVLEAKTTETLSALQ